MNSSPYFNVCTAGLASLAISLGWLRNFIFGSSERLISTYGDLVWNLAQIQTWMNAGPISPDTHLAYPVGFNPWTHPQLGILNGVISWVFAKFTPDVSLIFSLTVSIGALLDTIVLFLLFKMFSNNSFLAFIGSVYFGSGVFTLGLLGHSQVRIHYIIYLSLFLVLKAERIKPIQLFFIFFV
jgi:hypothetical protein